MDYVIIRVREHFEVLDSDGNFLFSADSYREALTDAEYHFAA